MSEKKRKAHAALDSSSRKKSVVEDQAGVIKVKVVHSEGFSKPVIASSPGLSLPSKIKFQSYTNSSELLLQSSRHPTVDFTAVEDVKADNAPLKHYVAVFDPTTKKLEIVEARKMTVRGQVRPKPKDEEQNAADAAAAAAAISNYTSRAALTEAFGTKKSKKAVQSIAENTLLARSADGHDAATNPLSNALLATTDDAIQDGADSVQENKPLPRANLAAETPNAVYPLTSLVFPSEGSLDHIDVSDWQSAVAEGQEVITRSRFVASRVESYVLASLSESEKERNEDSPALKRLRLLRYLLMLIELSTNISASGGFASGKKVMPTAKLLQKFGDPKPTTQMIEGARRRFVPPDNTMRSFETQLLHTTICALTLHLPSKRTMDKPALHFATEPSEIRDDLGVNDQTVRQYFRELGCRLDPVTEADASAWGIKKKKSKDAAASGDALNAKAHEIRVAKLRYPFSFPKRGSGKPNRGR